MHMNTIDENGTHPEEEIEKEDDEAVHSIP